MATSASKAGPCWGQVMLGPPGSGKTTYCRGVGEFLKSFGRDVALVNLDPANISLPFEADVDIADLVGVGDVMDHLKLGPNGAMLYAMEYLQANVAWLINQLRDLMAERPTVYLLFDLPGQVELYTHHDGLHSVVHRLQRELPLTLGVVHLVDATHCLEPTRFVSVVLLSLSVMLRMELPHINVISKADLVGDDHDALRLHIELNNAVELSSLLPMPGGGIGDVEPAHRSEWAGRERHHRLTAAICEVVEEFGLVSFKTLSIENKASVASVQAAVDKAIGCPTFAKELSQPDVEGLLKEFSGGGGR